MKLNKLLLCVFFVFGMVNTTNAQLWKKLKKKVQDKVEQKIDKETDKVIDKTLEGKKKVETKEETKETTEENKSYGAASINHSILYGTTSITSLTKSKVQKEGKQIKIIGYWDTFGVDVHDGYIIVLKNVDDINELQNKTFKIPEEASLRLDYDALVNGHYNFDQKIRAGQQDVAFTSGAITVTFNKDKNVMLSFSGNTLIDNYKIERTENSGLKGNVPATLSGNIRTTLPEYTITKELTQVAKTETSTALTESDKAFLKEKLSPTVNIPDSFSFETSVELEFTDNRGEKFPMEFLLGKYPDIYGISVSSKEMQGQGAVTMVMTPKSSTAFMDVAGMKMKRSTSLDQMGSQFNMTEKMPEDGNFEYKKTGKTKSILGYNCEEYRVDYNYTNSKGSSVFWVSKDFPLQNKELPMLGMKMNNPYFSGFVLELNTTHEGENYVIKVVKVSDKKVSIKTSEYKKMGF